MEAVGVAEPESSKKENNPGSNGAEPGLRSRDNNGQNDEPEDDEDEEEDESEDEEEDEPQLKYASLTKVINPLYRNGDATSTFVTGGDKMIIGTHNGNIHVYSIPLFQRLRVYHAHSASVTSISISPFPPPLPSRSDLMHTSPGEASGPSVSERSKSSHQPQPPTVPSTPSNSIYIATSSMDGNVCVTSLVDSKDVTLRNFGRPVDAVALSPEYKSDRTYLSGGRAGSLVLTVGGRIGTTSNSTIMGTSSATASGWFGSLGLGANNGKDTVLHSGEGAISSIKWSRSGKYVAWVNEEGIKIMRSHLHLEEAEHAWQRFCHTDRPRSQIWNEMVSVWKPRVEWIDEVSLMSEDASIAQENGFNPNQIYLKDKRPERLLVGWGGTIWIIKVSPGDRVNGTGMDMIGRATLLTKLRTDCIISGVSLYTQNLLLVLAYIVPENDDPESSTKGPRPSRGIRRWQNGQQPELRLIDIETEEELSNTTLTVRRYETLSASDYHVGILPPSVSPSTNHRGALETITTGLLDATLYPTRLFSSGTSVRSHTSSDKASSFRAPSSTDITGILNSEKHSKELGFTASPGIKIFIHSPYDCIVAVKRGLEDRLSWLDSHGQYEEAWELLDKHPEMVGSTLDGQDSIAETPTQHSPGRVFPDETSSIQTISRNDVSKSANEKRRIGELWLKQLISNDEWEKAGEVCGKVLKSTSGWERWIWVFARNHKFDEIALYVPIDIHPPLPSLIYEVILGHYVSRDRTKFSEFIELWPSHIFEVDSVIAAVEDQLASVSMKKDTEDWLILSHCAAKLYLAGGHYREALRCYIRLQDAETVMNLIREYHLLDSVADDIPGFILIRVAKDQMKSASTTELEEATSEPIKLLVREAANGIVHPETVISQLQTKDLRIFLYFYIRALWRGDFVTAATKPAIRARGHQRTDTEADKLAADEGRVLIDSFADTVLELFADYDRTLLMEFLQSSTSYSYSFASSICEDRHLTPELIYLFSKTGQTKRALHLILSDLKDVSHAISFAKSQDDPDLWDDLLSYSMDKPEYIRCLLTEVGTAIDPIKLVRRIPSGLEIEGLREGLKRMIREHDIQASISQGVAKVLAGEVAIRMDILRKGQRHGIKFDIIHDETDDDGKQRTQPNGDTGPQGETSENSEHNNDAPKPGRCAGCHNLFVEQETEVLVGFACGHVYHISHLHPPPPPQEEAGEESEGATTYPKSTFSTDQLQTSDTSPLISRTVGLKVTNARLLRDKVGAGCRICASNREKEK